MQLGQCGALLQHLRQARRSVISDAVESKIEEGK
jgi:hypothetical protein